MSGAIPPMAPWLEDAWLQRYLGGGLSASETEWFEAYLLERPDLVEALEADNTLRDALHASPGAFESAAAPARVVRRAPWMPFAMAATLVVGLAVGWLLAGPGQGGAPSAFAPGPTRVVFDTWRGSMAEPIVHRGAGDAPFVLVEVGLPPDATEVELVAGDRRVPLAVSADGFASFTAAADAAQRNGNVRLVYRTAAGPQEIDLSLDALEGDN